MRLVGKTAELHGVARFRQQEHLPEALVPLLRCSLGDKHSPVRAGGEQPPSHSTRGTARPVVEHIPSFANHSAFSIPFSNENVTLLTARISRELAALENLYGAAIRSSERNHRSTFSADSLQ